MLSQDLHSLLIGEESITAIIGTPATRFDKFDGVWPSLMPEKATLPAMVVAILASAADETMDGPGLQTTHVEISCYAAKYDDSKSLALAVRVFLEEWTGLFPDGTRVSNIYRATETDAFEEAPFMYRTALDMVILSSTPQAES